MKEPLVPASYVLEYPASDPKEARRYFETKLGVETDSWDVHADLENGVKGFILIDTRSASAYRKEHITGSVNLHYRLMDEKTTASLSKETLIVVVCAGVGCNAGAKGAAKLAGLGFRVKELLGGLAWWKQMGYPTQSY